LSYRFRECLYLLKTICCQTIYCNFSSVIFEYFGFNLLLFVPFPSLRVGPIIRWLYFINILLHLQHNLFLLKRKGKYCIKRLKSFRCSYLDSQSVMFSSRLVIWKHLWLQTQKFCTVWRRYLHLNQFLQTCLDHRYCSYVKNALSGNYWNYVYRVEIPLYLS
jgi:hypothetical protein